MKTLDFLFGLLAIIVLSYGCKQNSKDQQIEFQVINIEQSENTTANLSEFIEDSKMIVIETNDSCLISSISHVEITPKYLFVNDSKNLFQFDRSGKFIRKIGKRGRGPHEYRNITSFTCSEENEQIYIGTLGKILCFDFQGNFVEEIEKYALFDNMNIHNDQLWVFFTELERSNNGKFENRNKVYQYSLSGGVLKDSILLKTIVLDREVAVLAKNMQYLSETSDQTYLYCPILIGEPTIRDTLYTLEENQLIPAFKVDFSDFATSDDKKKNISILNINRNKKYLFAEYLFKNNRRLFVYDFLTDVQYNLTEGFNDDIFGTGNVMLRPLDVKFNQMYFVKDAYELVDIIEGISENSNPVIFIVDLKK